MRRYAAVPLRTLSVLLVAGLASGVGAAPRKEAGEKNMEARDMLKDRPPSKLANLPEGMAAETDIVYAPEPASPRQRLDILYHTDMSAPRPAIAIVHGGGWRRGHKESWHWKMLRYAKFGYVMLSIDYRLVDEVRYPEPLRDCKMAIQWLKANAAKYGVDPERIGVTGNSAGAHLSALVAVTDADFALQGDEPNAGFSPRVAAAAVESGAFDFRSPVAARFDKSDYPGMVKLIGGTRAEKPEAAAAASPVVHVSSDDPPFLILHGRTDGLFDYRRQAVPFHEALEAAGVESELVLLDNFGHGAKGKNRPSSDPYIEAFFARRLGPPKP